MSSHLQVPPLRERPEDIPLLAQHFLWRYATETNKKIDSIQPEAMEAMRRYPWPGNVRELENAIERAVVMGKTGKSSSAICLWPSPWKARPRWKSCPWRRWSASISPGSWPPAGGNLSNVAKILRINRTTLYQKIKKYGLAP